MIDVLLVGAGPIGLEMAAALRGHGVDYLHIEAGNIASTIAWYSPGTQIFSSPDRLAIAGCPFMVYPGVRALREDYLGYLRAVVEQHRLEIRRFHKLVEAKRVTDGFECGIAHSARGVGGPGWNTGGDGAVKMRVHAKRVILAVGNMHAPQLLNIPGEDAPWCSHYLGDIHQYAGCRVAIVGSRNSAAEAAVRLARLGCTVVMCFRRAELDAERIKPWIMPDLRTLVREGKVTLVPRVTARRVEPGALVVASLDDQKETEIRAERVLLLTGYVQDPGVFRMFSVPLQPTGRPVHNEETMETGSPGVYVAGNAAAGTQVSGVTHFIENSHAHVGRILKSLGLTREVPLVEERSPDLREA
jgi:thioredoxin reductase (NADPH)